MTCCVLVNLAMKKPVESSSKIWYGEAYRAVDSSISSKVMSVIEESPWLKIDLKEVYFVHDVMVLGVCDDSSGGPMLDLNIRIGNDDHSRRFRGTIIITIVITSSFIRITITIIIVVAIIIL